MSLSLEDGKKLVKLARGAIFAPDSTTISGFEGKKGAFVTIYSYPTRMLRGCIGFIEPLFPLKEAVIKAAQAAAFQDRRFNPVHKDEKVVIEVSVLEPPKIIEGKKSDYLKLIKIGSDGLIVEFSGYYGLLLPIVAVEYKWGVEEFLEQTCIKAGLPPKTWKEPGCKVYKFQTQVFSEKTPNGQVEQKM